MLTEDAIELALHMVQDRLDDVNSLYIKKVARQIKKIGELNTSSINRLIVMAEVEQDAAEVTQALAVAMGETITDVQKIYKAAMQSVEMDPRFRLYFEDTGKAMPT